MAKRGTAIPMFTPPSKAEMERYMGYQNFVGYPTDSPMGAGVAKPDCSTGICKPIDTINTRQDMLPPVPEATRR